jgi:hypothetical protein
MTSKKRGLAAWKESPNGGANRPLAGNEWWVDLTSALEKEVAKEEGSAGISLFIGEVEREEAAPVPHVGVSTPVACRTGWTMAWRRVPYPRSLTGGPRLVFSNLT